jgi:hypothetical protein
MATAWLVTPQGPGLAGTLPVGYMWATKRETTDVDLRTAFPPFDKVISVKIVSAVAGEPRDSDT